MKNKQTLAELIIHSSSFLFILLFTYAGLSKAFDYENFRLQVAQSPLLTAFAGTVAVATLFAEFCVVLLLAFERTRRAGLLGSYILMCAFTVYIFLILNYSPYVPCSCGGILEDMDWKQHLYFNIAFTLLGAAALQSYSSGSASGRRQALLSTGIFVTCGCLITGLFLFSEHTLHERNNFVRRIPPFILEKKGEKELGFDSYYIAGAGKDRVYLGNYTTPSVITAFDTQLRKSVARIALDDTVAKLDAARVKIAGRNFFVYDGKVPCVYVGNIKDWKADLRLHGVQHFTELCPIDSVTAIFKAQTVKYGNLLGLFDFRDHGKADYAYGLLKRQIDGVFDTDGSMHYSAEKGKFIYTYLYRNQFTVTDRNLKIYYRGKTIDTTSRAKIKVDSLKSRKQTKMAAPPVVVNRTTAVYRNLLFINSTLPGKYDTERMWKKACVVDVYDLDSKNYLMSFYLNNSTEVRMQHFTVTGNYLFAMYDTKVAVFKINEFITKYYR